MKEVTIEKGIPIPPRPGGTGRPPILREVLMALEPGDSFIHTKGIRNWGIAAKRVGIRIVTRKQPDGTYRIWRLE